MIRFILKSIVVAVLAAIVVWEIRLLLRIIGPEVAPIWDRVRSKVREVAA